jgi:O-antigen/teichoic acid export membrane protein
LTSLLARLGLRHTDHVAVARDFSVYSAVNVVSLVVQLGTALALRRFLGPVLAGVWITLDVLPNYAQYAHLGILNSAERDLPFLLGGGQTHEFERRKQTLFWLTHALGAAVSIAVAAGAFAYRSRIDQTELFVGLLAYAPILWLQILAAFYVVLYRARKRFVVLSTRQGTINLTRAVLTLALGYTFGLYGIFAALVTAAIVQAILLHRGLDERFAPLFDRRILRPMLVAGLPMLAGGIAFETIRNADRFLILRVFGLESVGVYSVVPVICQGVFYVPNTLSLVMYPRFQERFAVAQTVRSLRRFVLLPLDVLGNLLAAGTLVLMVALAPVLSAWLPDYAASMPALRVMLVATYFLCLSPPAAQLLLTVHKQVDVLFIAIPSTALALIAGYLAAPYGLVGVCAGIAFGCFAHFAAINLYALKQVGEWPEAIGPVLLASLKAAAAAAAFWMIERFIPDGPAPFDVIGGWKLMAALIVATPFIAAAARQLRAVATSSGDGVPVDNRGMDH